MPTIPLTFDPQLAEHIPGLRVTGTMVSGTTDALAVLAQRGLIAVENITFIEPGADASLFPELRSYQNIGVSWLAGKLRRDSGALLADDMGLGKTVQTIKTWEYMGKPGPLLIVAPASVRRGWVKEFKKWVGVDATLIETGKKAQAVTKENSVVVTSYELVKQLPNTFVPNMMVMDEAQLVRGRMAKRSNHLLDLAKLVPFKLALTGTPMWSRPRDFWMLLKILFGRRFGTADEFDYAYCGAYINEWGGKKNDGCTRSAELKLRIQFVMLRRLKSEVAKELPPITRSVRWVKPLKAATKALESFALKQLSFPKALEATLDAKLDATVEACVEAGKFLLFTWQKRHVEELAKRLVEEGVEVEVLTGDYTHAERAAAVTRAQKSGASVIATIDSTNAGVDGLQHVADTVIFHSLDYVPIKMAQAEARLHRIGQTNPVTVVYMALEESADAFVIQTVVEKLDQWTATMGKDDALGMTQALTTDAGGSEEAALASIYAAMGDEE